MAKGAATFPCDGIRSKMGDNIPLVKGYIAKGATTFLYGGYIAKGVTAFLF